MATIRELSRKDWTGKDTIEYINSGHQQRIADALENIQREQIRHNREKINEPPQNIGDILRELNKMQMWYNKKIASLNTKISLLNKRIGKLEPK